MVKKSRVTKKITVCFLVCLMVMNSWGVLAFSSEISGGFQLALDNEIAVPKVDISGRITSNGALRKVSLQVLYCGEVDPSNMTTVAFIEAYNAKKMELESYGNEGSLKGSVVYYEEKFTNFTGNYSFSYNHKGESGLYAARISLEDENFIRYILYNLFDPAQLSSTLVQMNGATDSISMKNIVEQSGYLFNFDFDAYNALGDDKTKMVELLYSYRQALPNRLFLSGKDLLRYFNEALEVQQINKTSDAETVRNILSKVGSPANIDTTVAYSTYDKLSHTYQLEVLDKISKSDGYKNADDIRYAFNEKTVLTAVHRVSNWSMINKIIKDNNEFLSFDFSQYSNDVIAEQVDKAISGIPFSSIGDLKTAFEYAIAQAVKNLNQGSTNNRPRESGGSGGSIRVEKDLLTDITQKTENNNTPFDNMPYADIEDKEWAKESILDLTKLNVLQGDNGVFRPDDRVTREEFTKMIVMGFNLLKEDAKSDFSDVDNGQWYYNYIASAVESGIIQGIDSNNFGTGLNIIRQDMAVIAYRILTSRAIEIPKTKEKLHFGDEDMINDYAMEAVLELQQGGIINGIGNNHFNPHGYATRAEAAVIIHRLISLNTN